MLAPATVLRRWFEGAESPVEAAAVIERRLGRGGPAEGKNALVASDLDLLRERAADSARRIRAGRARPLEGWPVVVKDNIAVTGLPTRVGTKASIEVPDRQAEVVDRLVDAGAIPYAKANMTELALRGHGRNPHFGDVAAPGARGYLAGGSSSGSAASLRLGLAALAIGTDTAGSVRMPAAACGVIGYKPAHSALPLDGVVPLSQTCDHIGLLARRVDELEAAMAALGLPPGPPPIRELAVIRPVEAALGPLAPAQSAGFKAAAQVLGSSLDSAPRIDAAFFDECADVYDRIRAFEATINFAPLLRAGGAGLSLETVTTLKRFAQVKADEYHEALARRREMRAELAAELAGRALLLLPTMSILAPPATGESVTLAGRSFPLHSAMIRLVVCFSLLGLPAMALPADVSAATSGPTGLTPSVQLVSAAGDEAALFAAARQLERALDDRAESRT